MGNTIGTPGQVPDTLETEYNNFLKVATADTGDAYDADDVNKTQDARKVNVKSC